MQQLRIVWAALLMSVVVFAAVAWFVGPQLRSPGLPPVVPLAFLAMAAMLVVVSQVVGRSAGVRVPKQQKAILSFALSEAAGLVSGVALMLSGEVLCLGGIAVAVASLASLYPRDAAESETVKLMP